MWQVPLFHQIYFFTTNLGWFSRPYATDYECAVTKLSVKRCYCMPKKLYGVFPHLFLNHQFCTLLIIPFTIALIKCSVCLYSTFYLSIFFHKFILGFSCNCYLLNTLKCSSNHNTSKYLQVFLLFVYMVFQKKKWYHFVSYNFLLGAID